MGFQSPESGVPGEGSFPAGQHSSTLREGQGMGLLGEGRRLISIPLAYSLRCAGRACRRQPRLRANKAPFIPRAGLLRAADGLAPARHPADPGVRPGQGAHRAGFRRPAPARATRGFFLSRLHNEDRLTPAFIAGRGGSADTESFQRGNPQFTHGPFRATMSVSTTLSLAPHPCPPRDGTAQSSQVVRGLCFSS